LNIYSAPENPNAEIKRLASSLHFRIAVLKECNYKCSYCYPFGQNKGIGANMSKIEAESIIDAITEIGFNKIKFTGGEPTLVPWFSEILEYSIKRNPDVLLTIVTNGSTLERYIDTFEKYKNNINLQFSLDSANSESREHGIYKILNPKTEHSLYELSKRGIKTRINMVVTRANKNEVHEMIGMASRLGFSIKLFNLFFQDQYIATDNPTWQKRFGSVEPYEYWKSNYVNLGEFVPELRKKATEVIKHYEKDGKYGISYGFVVNGIEVLLGDTSKGAFYHREVCVNNCPYFKKMCEKGIYNPHLSSNLTLYPDDCFNPKLRWNLRGTTHEQKLEALTGLLNIFKDVEFLPIQIDPITSLTNQNIVT
jgi:MoaA/NifB/PqqE/SkfB family radical SAM enzyme